MTNRTMADRPDKPLDWLRPRGADWTRGPARRVHDNPYFAVDIYDAVAPTGVAGAYYVHQHKNLAVGVVPLHPDGSITLVGQWRFPFSAYSWELPEGGVPPDEAALDGARRELREEAGLVGSDWREILRMQLSNASSDELAIIYLATGFTQVETDPDPTEQLATVRVPFSEALDAVLSGEILDSLTVAALLRVHHMASTGALPSDLAATVLGSDGNAPGR